MSDNIQSKETCEISWFPGHMSKTKRQIKDIISTIDIVLHVVDARIPCSSYIKDISSYTYNKKEIILMTKYDLCDKEETDKWIKYYEDNGKYVLACDLKNGNEHKKVIKLVEKVMTDINKKRESKGLLPKKAKLLVVGVPNVGKSTLINRLVNKKVNVTGNKPGVTKSLNVTRINEYVDLVDSPGMLWPRLTGENVAYNLGVFGNIKPEILPLDEIALYILRTLSTYYKDIMSKYYNLTEYNEEDVIEMYEVISKHRNISFYSGEPGYDRINLLIYNDINTERLKGITFDRI